MHRPHQKLTLIIFLFCFAGCSFTSPFSGYTNANTVLDPNSQYTPAPSDETQSKLDQPDVTADKFKIMHAYQFKVEKFDGISADEAVVIAQSEVIFRGYDKEYYITKPNLKKLDDTSWAVEFYPVNKTFIDSISKPKLLITVEKTDGKLSWTFIS